MIKEIKVLQIENLKLYYIILKGDIYMTDNEKAMQYVNRGDLNGLKNMIAEGYDMRMNQEHLLCTAACWDHVHILKYMIAQGLNHRIAEDAPLRHASTMGSLKTVKYLMAIGADINACEGAALKRAAQNGNLKIAKALLDLGADPCMATHDGYLMHELKKCNNEEMLKLLKRTAKLKEIKDNVC